MLSVENVLDLDRLAGDSGYGPGNGVDLGQGQIEGSSHVANGCTRPQGTEGDYLRHFFLPIAAHGVLYHFVAHVVRIVQVDVRHRHPARVEKSFEDQAVLERVDAGNTEGVSNHRSRA